MSDSIVTMIGDKVVLDTATTIVYIGTLASVTDHTFVLDDADMHDCRDGHATKEVYVSQTTRALEGKVAVNRRRVVVMRSAVISLSRLTDVVQE
ncbi:MAG: hypothetical protein ACE5EX_05425 [Phycisphaerae bacterium]